MAVDVILLRKAESQGEKWRLLPNKPTLVPRDLDSVGSSASGRVAGMAGIVAVAAIIGISIYSVVRYLL